MALSGREARYVVQEPARYTARRGCGWTGRPARENIVSRRSGACGGNVMGGRNVYISGEGLSHSWPSCHHARSNFRNSFSRLPNPRVVIADWILAGRQGSKEIVFRWRQPSGALSITACAFKMESSVTTWK